jgi:hypothetical protein
MRSYSESSNPSRRIATIVAASVLGGALALAGCSTTPLPQETPKQAIAVANFDLNKCRELDAGLFRCPAVDKPLCNPDFARTDVDCVHVGKKGELMSPQ